MKIIQSQINTSNCQRSETSFSGRKSFIGSIIRANGEAEKGFKTCYGGVHSNRMNPFEKLLWKIKDLAKKFQTK